MFVKISKPPVGGNKGSCQQLVDYLDKDENTKFFGRGEEMDEVKSFKVRREIDKNVKGLTQGDDKFYMLSINPSHKELEHLAGREVSDFASLGEDERKMLFEKLKTYTHDVMDAYAKNFNREHVQGGDDLVYFARVETSRAYRHYDKDVVDGVRRPGEEKEGLNLHIHVIVSRNSKEWKDDDTNEVKRAKLSPNGRFRGAEWERDGKIVQRGFDHTAFKTEVNQMFADRFDYVYQGKEAFHTHSSVSILDQASNKVEQTVKNKIKQEVFQDSLKTERQLVRDVQAVVKAISNPKLAIKQQVKKAVKNLLTPGKDF